MLKEVMQVPEDNGNFVPIKWVHVEYCKDKYYLIRESQWGLVKVKLGFTNNRGKSQLLDFQKVFDKTPHNKFIIKTEVME